MQDTEETGPVRTSLPGYRPAAEREGSPEHADTVREKESEIVKAAIFRGPGAVEVGERPDPVIEAPTDAVVRVVLACVCGSDLWYYRGETPHAVGSIGHEFIGVVEEIGARRRQRLAAGTWWSPRSSTATCPARTA